ncbi:MAG: hypothetical protein IJM39_06450 [Firmicutes bacterium]|nr:hypothetical protein [Bacillota bacterium]
MEENKKSRLPLILVIVFVLILAALYVYLYLLPQISGSRTENYIVSYAKIRESADLKCILARNETVYTSGGAGSVSYYIEEGTKTRKTTRIADVYSGSRQSFYAQHTGYVTYYLDGYEEQLHPNRFQELDPDELSELGDIVPRSDKPSQVDSDKPIFKLIQGDTWHVLILVPSDMKGQYSSGQRLTVEFPDGASVPGRVSYIKDGQKYQLVVADISRWYDKELQIRTVKAKIISSETEGLLIPTSAITTNGENYGVYVMGLDGKYSFRTVDVLIEGSKETLIASGGSVKLYDEVLKDARNYKE